MNKRQTNKLSKMTSTRYPYKSEYTVAVTVLVFRLDSIKLCVYQTNKEMLISLDLHRERGPTVAYYRLKRITLKQL